MNSHDFPIVPGSLLSLMSCSYKVESFLGEGTFGKVAKCLNTNTNKMVAIKIMKDTRRSVQDAKRELAVLKKVKSLDPDTCNIVQWNCSFIYRNYMCLEFELLDVSLRDFLKQRNYWPLPLKEIRPILHQCATALKHLKDINIIHTDLKPDNIMMVDRRRQPLRVKIIDFGAACAVSEARQCWYIQTRWYRSPEVMLGLPFSEAIDMWSLGTVAAELFLGHALYPGSSEYDMLRFIVETQGQPPDHLLRSGQKTCRYFHKETSDSWRLKTQREVRKEMRIKSRETRRYQLKNLDDLKQVHQSDHASDVSFSTAKLRDQRQFVDMLKQMLHLDARRRITPSQLLEHPFISMSHLENMYPESLHVRSCFLKMDICRRQQQTSDSRNGSAQTTQQPSLHQQASSGTAHHDQHRVRPQLQPAAMSLAGPLHQGTDSRPSTSTQTQSQRSAVKRKRAEPEDREADNRNTKACLPTTSTTHAASNSGPPKAEPNRTDERTVLLGKSKTSAGHLASQSRKRSAPYIIPKRTANQGGHDVASSSSFGPAPSSSSGRAAAGAQNGLRPAASTIRGATGQTGSKRARLSPLIEDNRGRAGAKTEAPRATAQANTNTSTSQTGTISPTAQNWYAAFIPELLVCFKSTGPKQS
ncbi:homeodomain-interacting protein kinase 2-like [Myripristis murdjan]|uniref:homeodomain-interacting protein kinase 2-like n=1 Tax=Myripristis murdjan TaxID=586833 RepID=UPI0011761427|nr:homeodomain-interacting protein kinase 2-like [Myripristis murdjan]